MFTAAPLDDAACEALDTDGYAVFTDVLTVEQVEAVRARVAAVLQTDDQYRRQGGTVHVGDLQGSEIETIWKALMPAVRHVLGPDAARGQANFRAPLPGHGGQGLHADFGGPPPPGGPVVAVAVVALLDIDAGAGATRVVPGTHTWNKSAPGGQPERRWPGEQLVALPAGAALLLNGHLWHSGTRNGSDRRRDALQVTFARPGARSGGS